jgi:chromosome transmission fidelity protein 4
LSDDEEELKSSIDKKSDNIVVNIGDDDEDDLESLEKLKAKTYNSVKREIMMMDEDSNEDPPEMGEKRREAFISKPVSVFQKAFQPSSTPHALPERYMAWNSIGLITQFNKDDDESIDIEFHNASLHHTIHIKNQYGYSMADVSKEAVVLASTGKKDEEDPEMQDLYPTSSKESKLTCILLNSCDNTKEWSIDMLRKEYIRCVCASKLMVACATSRKFIRIYCLAGTQKEILCIPGTPVCISAYDNVIFVAYNNSNGSVGYSIYYIDDLMKREAEHGLLPFSDGSKIEWIGFSDEGNPYCYDSNGYLYSKCLTVSKMGTWTPLSYLRAKLNHKSDNYWLIGVSERNQTLKTILCKGSKYPNVLPRPNLSVIPITLPLIDPDGEKTQMEHEYWKNKYFSLNIKNYDCSSGNVELDQDELEEKVEKFESSCRETLMKLFMLACKGSKEQRAYEIATIMDTGALQLAIKYATKTRALVLAQNLNLLADRKAEIEAAKERLEYEEQQQHMQSYNFSSRIYAEQASRMDADPSGTNDDDVIIESSKKSNTQLTTQQTQIRSTFDTQSSDMDQVLTPTIPLTATRINPFGKKATPLQDASKSIMNEIEDRVNKSSQATYVSLIKFEFARKVLN